MIFHLSGLIVIIIIIIIIIIIRIARAGRKRGRVVRSEKIFKI